MLTGRTDMKRRLSSAVVRYRFDILAVVALVAALVIIDGRALDGPLTGDDSISTMVAQNIAAGEGQTTPGGYPYPRAPLFHHLLSIPIGLFGATATVARTWALSFSVVTVISWYTIGRWVDGRLVAVGSVALLIASTRFQRYSVWPRMYPFALAFISATMVALLYADRRESPLALGVAWAFSLLAFFTHRLAVMAVLVVGVVTAAELAPRWRALSRGRQAVFAFAGAGFTLWLGVKALARIPFADLWINTYPLRHLLDVMPAVVVLAAIGGFALLRRVLAGQRNGERPLVALWLVSMPVYTVLVYSMITHRPRYLIFIFPLIFLSAVLPLRLGATRLASWADRQGYDVSRRVATAVVVVLAVSALIPTGAAFSAEMRHGRSPEVFDTVRAADAESEMTLIAHEPHTAMMNAGRVDYWLMPGDGRREKYSVNGSGVTHQVTGAPILKNLSELRRAESEAPQTTIVWHSYRRRAMSQPVLDYVAENYYYYPEISHSRPGSPRGFELWTKTPIEGETVCKVEKIQKKPDTWEPQCGPPPK